LAPSGTVEIGGTHHPARAERWPIEAGTEIVVTGFDLAGLFVRKFVPSQDEPAKTHVQLDDLIRAEEQRREALRVRIEEERRHSEESERRREEEQSKARDPYFRWWWVLGLFLGGLCGLLCSLPRVLSERGIQEVDVPMRAAVNAGLILLCYAGIFAVLLFLRLLAAVYHLRDLEARRELKWWLSVPGLLWSALAILAPMVGLQWLAWAAGAEDVTNWHWSVPLGSAAGGFMLLVRGRYFMSTTPLPVRLFCWLLFWVMPACIVLVGYALYKQT
jgi:hypothetical protein